jgi:hypothetical protein
MTPSNCRLKCFLYSVTVPLSFGSKVLFHLDNHISLKTTSKYYLMYTTLTQELAELADWLTGCGKVAEGWCLVVRNFSVTRSTVLTGVGRRHQTKPDAVAAQVTCS